MYVDKAVARRYANSFFQAAKGSGEFEKVEPALKALAERFADASHSRYTRMMMSQAAPKKMKAAFMDAIMTGQQIPEVLCSFIRLLIQNNRLSTFFHIVDHFKELVIISNNMQKCHFVFYELDAMLCMQIKDTVEKALSKSIVIETTVDADLLGGFVIAIGNSVIDMSTRMRLKKLRKILM